VPRPDFLTLDDLIDLARKSKLPDIAKAYELWKWHEGDRNRRMLIHKDFLAETFAGYRKLMLQVTERAVKPGVESFTGYRQSNASEFVDKVGSEWGKLPISTRAVVYAMGVNEINAKMAGPILAAPTAGACGIVPGVLRALHDSTAQEDGDKASRLEHREVEGLMIAALIGLVINNVVPTAGATHGCQAECGTGAAMAAAMAVHILGGEAEACINAAALALKNSLGLVCDPLGGRVEVPCIKRAGMKAGEAVEAATLAMHGVTSAIPPSDVVRAMEEIGDNLLSIYKETSRGGLAITPMGRGNQAAAGLAGCEEE
jgi:L-serine dehydratase